jgi:hypothetical protein
MPTEHRKDRGGQTWHFCRNCSHWPEDNYEVHIMPPGTGELCNECIALRKQAKCEDIRLGRRAP